MSSSISNHSWASQDVIEGLDKTVYGELLSRDIAKYLKTFGQICNTHRDYCGTGLFYHTNTNTHTNGHFTYSYVNDGYCDTTIQDFPDEESFVSWLSSQSDYTMSGVNEETHSFYLNNQRITREMLERCILEN